MIIIQEILISDDVINKKFLCQLSACKGACCWEGDFGAPLEEEEKVIIDELYPKLKHLLSDESNSVIEEQGTNVFYEENKEFGTTLLKNGACTFMTFQDGIAKCGIEKAYELGITTFKKPISCHLYPVRINRNDHFEALNYDIWDICSDACIAGKRADLPVYQFVKDAIIRKYGQDFYEELDNAANANILNQK